MSEELLKALMQLFAIIALPSSDEQASEGPESGNEESDGQSDRRTVVESFLKKQLNQELVDTYMTAFDNFYAENTKKKDGSKKRRSIAKRSVKVLKICTDINEELTQNQKILVLSQLYEFSRSSEYTIADQEAEFINTVAELFYIPEEENHLIKEFVIKDFFEMVVSKNILTIDDNDRYKGDDLHLSNIGIRGKIKVLYIASSNVYLFRYQGKAEMFLNGQIIQSDKIYIFNTGSAIRNSHSAPIYYSDIVSSFNKDDSKASITFKVENIQYKFKNGNIGLHDVSFSEKSGHLVAIMGASGAGKTTLLNVLNGSTKPSKGNVTINGIDIHREKEKIDGLIGFVAQDDLLIEDLSVYDNLYYNAKLCFDNYTQEQIVETVDELLKSLGLYAIRNIQVGSPLNKKISGGQRKRLNIALELLREPAVLFLDEPTSGLSSRDSENIMDLLKELTLKGKLIFVVLHQPSSDIFKMFDNLVLLDTGGYLIYDGKPVDSIMYFKERIHHANWNESECRTCGNVNPEQIFNIVESNVLDEYGKVTKTRKISPTEWTGHFTEFKEKKNIEKEKGINPEPSSELPEISFKIPNGFKQFLVFGIRDVLSKLANTQYLVINLLEAPLLAFILSYIIKYFDISTSNEYGYTFYKNSNVPVYLFLSVIVAIFIGLTVSAEEIIKDRKILKREAFLNLSRSSYLLAKVFVLVIISAIQSFIFVSVGNSIIELKGMFFEYWFVLFSAWVASTMMGLVISDSFKTVVTIYILIPFLVIPQILLSGVIVKYEKLNPTISSPSSIPWYGEIITARWAYEALATYQFINNRYEKDLYPYDKIKSITEYKKVYYIPDLKNRVTFIKRNLDERDTYKDEIEGRLKLLQNEIKKENEINKLVKFSKIDQVNPNDINPQLLKELKEYLDKLTDYYKQVYKKASNKRDEVITSKQKTSEERDAFLELKRRYHNEKLTDFVENKNDFVRIIDFKGELFQKVDPIYLDPEPRFLKAHFYAPRKFVFGSYLSTYWANILVIWFITVMFYAVLYFRLLKRLLDYFENLSYKKS